MDIGEANDQNNNIANYASSHNQYAESANLQADNYHKKMVAGMNTKISNATSKQSLLKGYDEGASGVGGVSAFLTGAKVYGDAKNFDSEVAGFGQGKGASGYLASQSQLVKGRMAQGKQTLSTALGTRDADDVAKSGADLGLKRTITGVGTTPWDLDADASKIADTTQEGKAVAKASGGLFGVAKGAEGGVAGGIIKQAGKFVSDMPEGQLSAVGDIAGKGIGLFSAGKGIADDIQGDWSKDTGAEKVANVGDIVAGGLDALSMAIPMLAPVGAVATGISSLLDIGSQADKTSKDIGAIKKASPASAPVPVKSGMSAPSLSSAGLVAKQQLSAY